MAVDSNQLRPDDTDMTSKKILVVDDDSAIRNLVHRFLGKRNYQMESVGDGETALKVFEQFNPDLVILDVMLPDIIGYDVCQRMKEIRKSVLVMLLTSLTDVEDQVTGLEWADAYVTKPFHLPLLEKQVQALLRLLQPPVTTFERRCLVFGNLSIDPVGREVTLDNQLVTLTALEFDLLHCLAQHPKRVWSREELITKVWGHKFVGEGRVVDVHIGQIRRKIEPNSSKPTFIQTNRGVGYKFEPPGAT
jgi:two-component system OmpR family response regulator